MTGRRFRGSLKGVVGFIGALACGAQAAPGDSAFAGVRIHTINLRFDQGDWKTVVVPMLQAGRTADTYVVAQAVINGQVFDSVGVKYKGQSSYLLAGEKKSFRVSLDEFGGDGLWDGMKSFSLNNAYRDASFLREKIHLDFCAAAGISAPRANYARVLINDEPYAFYVLIENVDKRFLGTRFVDKDGDLFKAVDDFPSDFARREDYTAQAYASRYEYRSDEDARGWARLVELIDTLNLSAALSTSLPKLVDMQALYKGFGADILFSNNDSYVYVSRNFHVYFPVAGKMQWIAWDVDGTFSNGSTLPSYGVRNSLTRGEQNGGPPLANRVFKDPVLKQEYLKALWELYRAHFSGPRLAARIDSLAAVIRADVRADTRRAHPDTAAFTREVAALKTFLSARQAYVRQSFEEYGFIDSTTTLAPRRAPAARLNLAHAGVSGSGTRVTFSLPAPREVRLTVRDARGRELAVLAQGRYERGDHTVLFDAARSPAGIHFYHLRTDVSEITRARMWAR